MSDISEEPTVDTRKETTLENSTPIEVTSSEEMTAEEAGEKEQSREPDRLLTEVVTKRPPKLNLKEIGKEEEVEVCSMSILYPASFSIYSTHSAHSTTTFSGVCPRSRTRKIRL